MLLWHFHLFSLALAFDSVNLTTARARVRARCGSRHPRGGRGLGGAKGARFTRLGRYNPRILGLGYPDPTDMTVTVTEPNVDPRSLGVPVPHFPSCSPVSCTLAFSLSPLAVLRPSRCGVTCEGGKGSAVGWCAVQCGCVGLRVALRVALRCVASRRVASRRACCVECGWKSV